MKDWIAPLVIAMLIAVFTTLITIQNDRIKELDTKVDQLTMTYVQMTGHLLGESK